MPEQWHAHKASLPSLYHSIVPALIPHSFRAKASVRQARRTRQLGDRWVPVKQTNGIAIYHLDPDGAEVDSGMGGEFMVSASIRGAPADVLDVLMEGSANTTILGPGREGVGVYSPQTCLQSGMEGGGTGNRPPCQPSDPGSKRQRGPGGTAVPCVTSNELLQCSRCRRAPSESFHSSPYAHNTRPARPVPS